MFETIAMTVVVALYFFVSVDATKKHCKNNIEDS